MERFNEISSSYKGSITNLFISYGGMRCILVGYRPTFHFSWKAFALVLSPFIRLCFYLLLTDIIKHFTATLESVGAADDRLGDLPQLRADGGTSGALRWRFQRSSFLHTWGLTAKTHTSGAKHLTLSFMRRTLYNIISCSSINNTDLMQRLSRLVVPLAYPCYPVTQTSLGRHWKIIIFTSKIY